MKPHVSVVVPSLDDRELLNRSLPPLLAECSHASVPIEVLVVDDTGGSELAAWLAAQHPRVQCLASPANQGFGAAALAGVERAGGELVFLMNPDVIVRDGFLEPLVRALDDTAIFAASPRVLLFGDERTNESLNTLTWSEGGLVVTPRSQRSCTNELRHTAFAIGGAMLVRRSEFLAVGGFDPLFAPFYWEDVDLCIAAWRTGRRVVEVGASRVEHHHRGTIAGCVPRELVEAAIERNRHLLAWKHVSDPDEARAIVQTILRDIVGATATDRRAQLVHLCLAFEQLDALARARAAIPASALSLAECLGAIDVGP